MNKINNSKDMRILIGQPKIYPENIVMEMKIFFNSNLLVRKAFLACVQYPNPDLPLKLIIGIEADNMEEIFIKFEEYLKIKKIKIAGVEFVNANDSPFKDYFLKINPFYEKYLRIY